MPTDFDGLTMAPPVGFELEDSQIVFRAREAPEPVGPTLARPRGVAPNLIVQRRRLADATSPEAYAERARAELAGLPQISAVESDELTFADEYPGIVLRYSFTSPSGLRVRQLQAIRVDEGVVVTVGQMTVPDTRPARDREREYLTALASICPT
jgi:hypothetical protein